jgi:hypothetical protein
VTAHGNRMEAVVFASHRRKDGEQENSDFGVILLTM